MSRYRTQGYSQRPTGHVQKRRVLSVDGIQAPVQQKRPVSAQPTQAVRPATVAQQLPRALMQPVQQKAPIKPAPRPVPQQQQRQAPQQNQVYHASAPTKPQPNHVQQSVQNPVRKAKKKGPIKRLTSFRFNNKRSMVFASLALCLFIVGVGVNLKSFMVSRKIQQTVEAAADPSVSRAGANANVDESPVTNQQIAAYQVAPNMPRYLKISELNVFSRVKRMGTTTSGAVDAPKSVFDTGWYDGSAKPGENGAVFIDGHVSGPTKGGVFANLKKLKTGSKIQVEMGDGRLFNYKVVAIEKYDANNVDMAKALRSIEPGKKGLNIMTCSGKYNEDAETFEQRLVAYTVQE